jgi:multidrug efflux pump subunit AcrA (membrane-fusion protein)
MTLKFKTLLNMKCTTQLFKTIVTSTVLAILILPVAACNEHSANQSNAVPKAEYAAIARGKTEVEGGLLDIVTPENGIFSHINVKLGDEIQQGQVLAQLDSHVAALDLAQAKAALAQAKAQQNMQAIRLPAAQRLASRWQKAAELGAAQLQQADDTSQSVAQIQAENAVSDAAVDVEQQKVDAATYALAKLTIRAPQAGNLVKVWIQQGSTATADQHIAFTILPNRPLIVRAEVNESFIGHIKIGMKASLFPEGSSSGKPVAAHVIQIGKLYETARLGNDPTLQNGRVVACILALDTASPSQQPDHNPQSTQTPPLLVGQNLLVKFYD